MSGKIKKFITNWKFLCKYVWKISPRTYAATAITIVLDVVEPFAVLLFPKFIIDELTGEKRWTLESHFKGDAFYQSKHRRILGNQSVELIKIQAKSQT